MHRELTGKAELQRRQRGFSMLEMMITLFILLGIAGIVMMAMMQMTMTQGMVANRTQMHGSVRSATELVQQEIGQSGRLPPFTTPVTLGAAVAPGTLVQATVNSVTGMFVNEQLVVDAGQMGSGLPSISQNPETVTVTAITLTPPTFTAAFNFSHNAGAPVVVAGAFPSGIIPTNATAPTSPSTPVLLKMYGDINGDGNMVYVEYKCDMSTTPGNLTRSVTLLTTLPLIKNAAQVILPNITQNPGGAACFVYEQKTIGTDTYVTDVSLTLTVQTQNVDPKTRQLQTETKALLNVAPRNVFDAWLLGGGAVTTRIQRMPGSVAILSQP
jgi:prepilin-type N-terminal cleavage/methylation domain-containing protein